MEQLSDQRRRTRWGQVSLDDLDSPEFRTLRGADVRVYVVLLPFFNEGKAWPRQRTLAALTGMSERHVSRAIARLEGAGFLRRESFEGDARRVRYVLLSPPSRRGVADGDF